MTTWLKAKTALVVIGLIWGSLIAFMSPLMIAARLYDSRRDEDVKSTWLYSILIAQDILVNCVLGGYFRTTVSSEVGNLRLKGSQTGAEVADFIDWGFRKSTGQLNHCVVSIEAEDRHLVTPSKSLVGASLYLIILSALIWNLLL